MQVCDAGQLLRGTLQAAHILMNLRGMTPLTLGVSEVDVRQWLERREAFEDLDEDLFVEVAHTFVAELLNHESRERTRGVRDIRAKWLGGRGRGGRACGRRRTHAEAEEQDEEEVEQEMQSRGEIIIKMPGNVYSIKRLESDYREFVPHLYPLFFNCVRPAAERKNPAHDYRLAAIVHTGETVKACNARIKDALERVDRLRHMRATALGFTGESAKSLPCRIMLIVWGSTFHPKAKSYNVVRRGIEAMNAKQRERGTHISLELWSIVELQYNAEEHEDVSRYTLITNPATVRELSTVQSHQFSYMRTNDTHVRLHDFRVGQLVRVDRTDFELGGKTYDYRMVVPHDYLLEQVGDAEEPED